MKLENVSVHGFEKDFFISNVAVDAITLRISNSTIADLSSLPTISKNSMFNKTICSKVKITSSVIGKLESFLLKHGSTLAEIILKDIVDESSGDSFFDFSNLVLPARKFKIKSSSKKKAKFDPSLLIATNAGVLSGNTSQQLRDEIHIVIETVVETPEFFPVFVDLSDTVKRFIYQYGPKYERGHTKRNKSFPVFYKEYDTLTGDKQGLELYITSKRFGKHWPRKILERMDRIHKLCILPDLLQTVEFGSFGVDKFIADILVTEPNCIPNTSFVYDKPINAKCAKSWAAQKCVKLIKG